MKCDEDDGGQRTTMMVYGEMGEEVDQIKLIVMVMEEEEERMMMLKATLLINGDDVGDYNEWLRC